MTATSDESIAGMERDIEESRRRMGETLDALQEKLSISSRARHAMEDLRETGARRVRGALQWGKENPQLVKVALVALPLLVGLLVMHKVRRR